MLSGEFAARHLGEHGHLVGHAPIAHPGADHALRARYLSGRPRARPARPSRRAGRAARCRLRTPPRCPAGSGRAPRRSPRIRRVSSSSISRPNVVVPSAIRLIVRPVRPSGACSIISLRGARYHEFNAVGECVAVRGRAGRGHAGAVESPRPHRPAHRHGAAFRGLDGAGVPDRDRVGEVPRADRSGCAGCAGRLLLRGLDRSAAAAHRADGGAARPGPPTPSAPSSAPPPPRSPCGAVSGWQSARAIPDSVARLPWNERSIGVPGMALPCTTNSS